MRKRRLYYSVSLGLFLIGMFFVLNAPLNITGAVIGTTLTSTSSYVVGIILVIVSIAIFAYRSTLEKIVAPELVDINEFATRFEQAEPNKSKRAIVLDTSAILDYSPQDMDRMLKRYDEIFVPDSVLKEIKNPRLRKVIEDNSQDIKGYKQFRKIAKDYLEVTEKPQLREFLLPYLNGEKQIKTRREQAEVNEKTKRVRNIMYEEEGIDLDLAKTNPQYALKKVRDYLDTHCKVSDTDTDVLAMALHQGRHRKHAIIGEKDKDFEEAVKYIKKEHPKIGKFVDYVNTYRKAA